MAMRMAKTRRGRRNSMARCPSGNFGIEIPMHGYTVEE
jgi:hypothetical protein